MKPYLLFFAAALWSGAAIAASAPTKDEPSGEGHRWILVVLIYDNSGSTKPTRLAHRSYATSEECNDNGENFREIKALPDSVKSFSVCVPEDWKDSATWEIVGKK